LKDLHTLTHGLLARNGGRPICSGCLASALRAEHHAVRRVLIDFRARGMIGNATRCRGCRSFSGLYDVVAWRGGAAGRRAA